MHLPVLLPVGVTPERKKSALAILGAADDALAGWSCDASTDCCRFGVTGREPWLTQVEWALVVDEVKRQGRKLPALPAPDDDDERCPFLSHAGRCTVYAARPLGCRTFYCERARGPGGEGQRALPKRELRALAPALAALTVKGDDDGGARPLRSWLEGALKRGPAKGSRAARRR